MLSCIHARGVMARHQVMLSFCEDNVTAKRQGARWERARRHIACHPDDDGEVDSLLKDPYNSAQDTGLDVTVVNTAAAGTISEAAVRDPERALRAAIQEKERRHRAQCKLAGIDYVTAACTIYGAMRGDYYTKYIDAPYREELANAKAAKVDEWEIVARHKRLLARISVLIARANAEILLEAVQPAAPHVRQRRARAACSPRTPAGLSLPPRKRLDMYGNGRLMAAMA